MTDEEQVVALISPVLARRYPDLTAHEIEVKARLFARIGIDTESLRYQIERGLLG